MKTFLCGGWFLAAFLVVVLIGAGLVIYMLTNDYALAPGNLSNVHCVAFRLILRKHLAAETPFYFIRNNTRRQASARPAPFALGAEDGFPWLLLSQHQCFKDEAPGGAKF
jgi:hypothetical protein